MQLQLQNFSALMTAAAASVQGAARQLVDLSVGSTLRAMLEASASMALWLQWLILQVLQTTRAATSTGVDLDTWVGDFTVARLPAVAATGTVSFSRFVTVSAGFVPVGTLVRTVDNSQTFQVVAAPGVAGFSALSSGFVLAVGAGSLDVPVVAIAAGSLGNVQPGAVTQIAAALPGVDTLTNAAAFQGGLDAESDVALRARFQNYLAGRSRATMAAVGYAISSVRQGLQYTIQENQLPDGSQRMGSFLVTLDDGSGNPGSDLLATTATAVDLMRPVGTSFAIQPPVVTWVTITLTVEVADSADHPAAVAAVDAAVTGYVNQLSIAAPLPWSRIAQVAYQASSFVTNVGSVLINGGTADLVPPTSGLVKAAAVTVS